MLPSIPEKRSHHQTVEANTWVGPLRQSQQGMGGPCIFCHGLWRNPPILTWRRRKGVPIHLKLPGEVNPRQCLWWGICYCKTTTIRRQSAARPQSIRGYRGVYPFMLDRLARSANSEVPILMPKQSRLNSPSTFSSRSGLQSPRRSSRTSKAIYCGYGAKTETIFHKGAANSKKYIAFVQML